MKQNRIFLFFLISLFLVSLTSVCGATLEDAITYGSYDDDKVSGSILLDSSPNGNDGTISGATTGQTGIINEAFSFDGVNDYVSYGQLVNGTNAFTVMGWANITDTAQDRGVIVGTVDGSTSASSGFVIRHLDDSSPARFQVLLGAGGGSWDCVITSGNVLNQNYWYHYALRRDASGNLDIFINGEPKGSASSCNVNIGDKALYFGSVNGNEPLEGLLDEWQVLDFAVSNAQVNESYNSGAGYNPFAGGSTGTNWTVTVTDFWNGSDVNNVTINTTFPNGSSFIATNTTGNTLYTNQTINESILVNVTILSRSQNILYPQYSENGVFYFAAPTYYSRTFIDVNMSETTNFKLKRQIINTSFNNFIEQNATNFTRTLYYNITLDECRPNKNTLLVYINGSNIRNHSYQCANNETTVNGTYQHSDEGNFTINFVATPIYNTSTYFIFNGTGCPIGCTLINLDFNIGNSTYATTNNFTFKSDLNNPVVTTTHNVISGFTTNATTTISMYCTDNIATELDYNLTFNNGLIFNGTLANATNQTNTTALGDGNNTITATCSDLFGETTDTTIFRAYKRTIILVDEITGDPFDVANVSGAKLWVADNKTFFDFKDNATNNITVITENETKMRIVLDYANGDEIVRYFDLIYLPDDNNNICANTDPTQHYENLIISTTEKVAVVENQYTNCYIGADKTRFAYQDSTSLTIWTRLSIYKIYTFDDGQQVFLGSIDGSRETFINLGTLESATDTFNLNVLGDSLVFKQLENTTIQIYYTNLNNDITNATLQISNAQTGTVYFIENDFSNPNNYTVYFNWASLSDVNETTIFRARLTTNKDGTVEVFNYFFNTNAKTGLINSALAMGLSIALVIFGLTILSARFTFSWLGVIILLAAIAITALGVSTWYLLLWQAICIIILIYTVILMTNQYTNTLT